MSWYQYFKVAAPAWLKVDPLDVETPALRFFNYLKSNNIQVPMYHGTTQDKLKKIQQQGFFTATEVHGEGQELNKSNGEEDPQVSGSGKIFFTRSMQYACQYAGMADESGKVVLSVNIPLYMIEEVRVALLYPDSQTYNEQDMDEKIKKIFYKPLKGTRRQVWITETTNEQKLKALQSFMKQKPPVDDETGIGTDEFTIKNAIRSKLITSVMDSNNPELWYADIEVHPYANDVPPFMLSDVKFMNKWSKKCLTDIQNQRVDYDLPKALLSYPGFQKTVTKYCLAELADPRAIDWMPQSLATIPSLQSAFITAYVNGIQNNTFNFNSLKDPVKTQVNQQLAKFAPKQKANPTQALSVQLNTNFNAMDLRKLLGMGDAGLDAGRGAILQNLPKLTDANLYNQITPVIREFFPYDKDLQSAVGRYKPKIASVWRQL